MTFITGIVTHVKESRCLLFANDCKLYKKIESNSDCLVLQKDLANMSIWCTNNLIPLLLITVLMVWCYKDRQQLLNFVLRGSCPTFSAQIPKVTNDAFRILGFIKRNTINFSAPCATITLCNALVLSKLDNTSTVGCLITIKEEKLIEKIQNKFL